MDDDNSVVGCESEAWESCVDPRLNSGLEDIVIGMPVRACIGADVAEVNVSSAVNTRMRVTAKGSNSARSPSSQCTAGFR